MCYFVLTRTGYEESRTTVQHATEEDMAKDEVKKQMEEVDEAIKERLKDENFIIGNGEDEFLGLSDEDTELVEEAHMDGADDYTPETLDDLLNAEVMLPHGDSYLKGTVIKRAKGEDGNPIGRHHDNPFLDTRKYEVRMSDGSVRECMHNVVAESMFSQADSEGERHLLLDEITNHKKDETAVSIEDGWLTTSSGNKRRKMTTRGWKLLVSWKDGSEDWMPLAELKSSYPVQVAEYTIANGITEEPAFAWWV